MKKSKTTKAAIAAAGTVAAAGVGLFALTNVIYDQIFTKNAMKRRGNNFTLSQAEKNIYARHPEMIHDDRTWFACRDTEEQILVSSRGETLHAEYLKPNEESHIWCLCIHGWTSCPQNVGIPVRHFHEKGWNVLIPHMRAHGKSEQNNVTMGWFDRLDMLDWIAYIISKDPEAQIFLIGVSMGSATVMMTSGELLPENVKCLIADCGYTSVWDELCAEISDMFHLPIHPIVDVFRFTTKIRAGYDIKKASSIDQLKKCTTPILFIHGEDDTFVPYSMLAKVYAAADCEKDILSVPEAAHAVSWDIHPEIYWPKVDSFIAKYINTEKK